MSLVLVAAVGAISAPAVTAATTPTKNTHHKKKKKGPTLQQQIKAAVAKAERSPDLWATVNKCQSPNPIDSTNDLVGIRGQMPSLGIAATMSISVSVSYWNYTDNQFEPANASSTLSLGTAAHGAHQGGLDFKFAPPTAGSQPYVVRGTITFEWKIAGKVVGTVTRNTGHGYANVGFSVPPGFSAGTCTLT